MIKLSIKSALLICGLVLAGWTSPMVAEVKGGGAAQRKTNQNQNAKPTATKIDSSASEDGYVAASSTHIDFTETAIDGKMKAPEGFMLQGRQGSGLSQMVKLRSNFRNELNNSKSATKALVK